MAGCGCGAAQAQARNAIDNGSVEGTMKVFDKLVNRREDLVPASDTPQEGEQVAYKNGVFVQTGKAKK